MNEAHIHLLVNHFPIILPVAALIVLIIGYLFKSDLTKRVGYFLFILAAIATVLAIQSGEKAEDIAEKLPDVTKELIHEHEESAEVFAVSSYGLGLLSLIALWFNYKKKSFADMIGYLVIIASLVVMYFGINTGNSGGEIRHTEIRNDFQSVQATDGAINNEIKDE